MHSFLPCYHENIFLKYSVSRTLIIITPIITYFLSASLFETSVSQKESSIQEEVCERKLCKFIKSIISLCHCSIQPKILYYSYFFFSFSIFHFKVKCIDTLCWAKYYMCASQVLLTTINLHKYSRRQVSLIPPFYR